MCSSDLKRFRQISDETQTRFLEYAWPGNVRELQNVMRQIVVLNQGEQITNDMLPLSLKQMSPAAVTPVEAAMETLQQPEVPSTPVVAVEDEPSPVPVAAVAEESEDEILPMWQMEELHIERALRACGQNVPKAAALLEVSPSTLYRKLKSGGKG